MYILPVFLLAGCVNSLDDYNVDQKNASAVTAEPLFTAALKSFADQLVTPNVNLNNFRLYSQQWATTTYLDEPRYIQTSRTIPQAFWDAMYRDVLSDLKEARRIIDADPLIPETTRANQLAQITVLEVFAWATLVDTFGDIPYSQALDFKNSLPAYDDDATIYPDLINRLNSAIGQFVDTGVGFGTGELLYAAKPAAQRIPSWRKFANSLKLRLGMMLADVNPTLAATTVQEAITAGVFTSNADNARFPYVNDPPNNNPVAGNLLVPTFTNRQDFIVSNTIVDKMHTLADPRQEFYFTQKFNVSGTSRFVGGLYGFQNSFPNFSKVNPTITAANFEGLLLDASEVQFLVAEAIARGFVTGDPAIHYDAAIRASIAYWGEKNLASTADVTAATNTYLGRPDVAWATAPGDYKQKIGNQKWIALFNRGWEAWVEWKRLNAPNLQPPTGTGITTPLQIPLRLIYPINEQTVNGANRAAADAAIGGDVATTRVFWDIN